MSAKAAVRRATSATPLRGSDTAGAGRPAAIPSAARTSDPRGPVTEPVSPAPTSAATAVASARTPNARAVAARAFARAIASGASTTTPHLSPGTGA